MLNKIKMENILNEVKAIVADAVELDVNEFNNDSHLYTDLGADSVIGFEISSKIQKKYKIVVKPEDISQLTSVDEIAKYVINHLRES